ncbi:hypothetical protein [Evansella cellulosilytica]|uniref:Uncharacterized protein n=1 Tax=Evansella cellulosilytica (strain ATCC 21833 / DSM 2522 / FERM P-1141 / JCM 9156 / N-4) TaxID=649639 RepID=E6TYI1_EVAC2|nr:hypothetical protein [Evansella cellulosilytica]ADU28919.1 hypothetical protein Bcell_0637 [Evansella cellulosilytica DSM 2522]
MIIMFDRPMAVGKKPLMIEKEGQSVGEMNRWFRPSKESPSTNPAYDVNINIETMTDSYEIIQVDYTLHHGHQWMLTKNKKEIGKLKGAKGLFAMHGVELHSELFPALIIVAKFLGGGEITADGMPIGETKTRGFLRNSKYIIDIEDITHKIEAPLIAGVVFAFWCSHKMG